MVPCRDGFNSYFNFFFKLIFFLSFQRLLHKANLGLPVQHWEAEGRDPEHHRVRQAGPEGHQPSGGEAVQDLRRGGENRVPG